MRRILITGGAGFIGSFVAEHIALRYPAARIILLDKMTYAADIANVESILSRDSVRLVVGDITDFALCERLLEGCDMLIHVAAESHVDNSFGNSLLFTRTNVLGTHCLIEACRHHRVPRVIHVSTDEVYGEVREGRCDESAPLNPTNPYSASKAAAEMIVNSYIHSFATPIVVVRANNIYGPRQYPEKIIPRFCLHLVLGKKLPIHGNGAHVRHYLAASDFAEAIGLLAERGEPGSVYNVGSDEAHTNLEIAAMVCDQFGVKLQEVAEFVGDRPFNDLRYSISSDRMRRLGWVQRRQLALELPGIAAWYRDNAHRYREPWPA